MLYHRVLITGANGLVGQALVERLSRLPEVDLLATARDAAPRLADYAGGYTPLDVSDPDAVRRVFQDFAPSAVVHLAAVTRVEEAEAERERAWALNVGATETLARATRALGARFVHLSTDFVFDGEGGPYAEGDRPAPVNYYGRTKLASENAVRTAGLRRWTIARTALGWGAAGGATRSNFATFLVDRLSHGVRTEVATDQVRTPTYLPDLADGVWRAIRYDKDGVFHLAGREILSTWDFAHRLAVHFGFDRDLLVPATTADLHPGATQRPLRTGLLILRAETELGYRPLSLDAALEDFSSRLGHSVPERSKP